MLIHMKNVIIGWAILALILTAFSLIAGPWLTTPTAADTAFAREYAGEMLIRLEKNKTEADQLSGEQARYHYLDGADDLARRKHAALHLRGDLARDFVYAFDCAEAWSRAAADAIQRPGDTDAPRRARAAHDRAYREFSAILTKDYTAQGR